MLMPPTTPARAVGVLLVDDNTELGELVREYLAREGFSPGGGWSVDELPTDREVTRQ